MIEPSLETVDTAHHADNQRRLMVLETKVDANTAVTEKLAKDTADLLEMWGDASVVFKWIRKVGAGVIWIGKVMTAIAVVYGAIRYGNSK